jgi:hypothetical protein
METSSFMYGGKKRYSVRQHSQARFNRRRLLILGEDARREGMDDARPEHDQYTQAEDAAHVQSFGCIGTALDRSVQGHTLDRHANRKWQLPALGKRLFIEKQLEVEIAASWSIEHAEVLRLFYYSAAGRYEGLIRLGVLALPM